MSSGLREALIDLNGAVKDLTSLHVQTYTGKIEMQVQNDDRGRTFDDINDAITEGLKVDPDTQKTKIKLVAESLYKFDGDSYNFITDDTISSSAIELHKTAVEGGIKTRQSLMEIGKSIFKL